MWNQLGEYIKKEARVAEKKNKRDKDVDDILDDVRASRMYFGHALQSSSATGFMEEYLYRGLAKLYEIEDKLSDL